MSDNFVEISIDDISDETLEHYFIDDEIVYKRQDMGLEFV